MTARNARRYASPAENPLLDFLFYAAVIGLVLVTLFVREIEATFKLSLLVVVWLVDVAIKKLGRVDTSSLFADLCFAAFIFVFTSIPNRVILSDTQNANIVFSLHTTTQWFWLFIGCVVLFLLWIGNIRLCNYIEIAEKQNMIPITHIKLYKVLSGVFGLAASIVAFLALIRGLI